MSLNPAQYHGTASLRVSSRQDFCSFRGHRMCVASPVLFPFQSCAQGPLCCLFSEPLWPGREKRFLTLERAAEGHVHLLKSPEKAGLFRLGVEGFQGILFSSEQDLLTQRGFLSVCVTNKLQSSGVLLQFCLEDRDKIPAACWSESCGHCILFPGEVTQESISCMWGP